MGKDRVRRASFQCWVQGLGRDVGLGSPCCLPPQLTDDVKKEKEKEPEKLDKLENSAAPKKKGFEEEHKDSDDDSSDDEQVRPPPRWEALGDGRPRRVPQETMVNSWKGKALCGELGRGSVVHSCS